MKPTEYQHFIFVRPPGSFTWTLHMRNNNPWRTGIADDANKEAERLARVTKYCAIVVPVKLPQEPDKHLYALFADKDTMIVPPEE